MSQKRINIYDYPEHLNPFYEYYSGAHKTDNRSKYGTWGSTSRTKIRSEIVNPTWLEALNLSPAKKKVSKRWSLLKSQAVEKFQRVRSKSNSFDHSIQRSDKRELKINIRPHRQFSERLPSNSSPVKDESLGSLDSKVTTKADTENMFVVQGAKPKIRKKRAPPTPPIGNFSSELDSENVYKWNTTEEQHRENNKLNVTSEVDTNEYIKAIDEYEPNSKNKIDYVETDKIKPLIEDPNITTLISTNITL